MTTLSSPTPNPATAELASEVPHTDSVASLPRKQRVSAKRAADWFWRQYQSGLTLRKPHAIQWVKVKSIMRGIHYFQVTRNGGWRPLKPPRGQLWATTKLMKPYFRHELGRLNSNVLGVTTRPARVDSDAILRADRAYNILTHWIEETEQQTVFDECNQDNLYEGMVGLHYYVDQVRQNVFTRPFPGSSMFPIPFDARSPREMDGLMHVGLVTEQWLEQQDEVFRMRNGKPPAKPMKRAAREMNTSLSADWPIIGSSSAEGGKLTGALAITVWMKPNDILQGGEYSFMLGDEMYRYHGATEKDSNPNLPFGRIPVEIMYYNKHPDDFWGYGFCEDLISSQMTMDRMITSYEQSAKSNRNINLYDTEAIQTDNVQISHDSWIPFQSSGLGSQQQPFLRIPPSQVGRDVDVLSGMVQQLADQAAGYRSNLIFGQAEGRNEGGPANQLLNANAQAPLVSTLSRIGIAYKNLYPRVLDLLKVAWPQNKSIRVAGPNNIGREIVITRDNMPASSDVLIDPVPFLPNGNNALANILFQLKQTPGQDGVLGSAVTDKEFLDSLQTMSLLPPKIDRTDDPGIRIQTRINRMINDGQTPGVRPANPGDDQDRMVFENHLLAMDLFRKAILDDKFEAYGQEVQQALIQEFQFHQGLTPAGFEHPQAFDDNAQDSDAQDLENFLSAQEADFNTAEGEILSEQLPPGLSP